MTLMHLRRTTTVVVVGAALAAWLAAAATSGTRTASEQSVPAVPPDPAVAALAAQVSRLHARLMPGAVPIQPGRDLFRFGGVRAKAAPPAPKPALVEAPSAVGSTAAARPTLKLDGIAEDAQDGGVVRTAVIATAGQLFLVREGDRVTTRFKVVRVGADAVELLDLVDNQSVRLPLR